MPRRPSKSRQKGGKPKPFNRSDAKIKKWNKPSDIPMDEEDEFHASRDHVLLDNGVQYDEDDEDMDEEVFALKGLEEDDSENEDMGMDEDEWEEESEEPLSSKEKEKKKSKSKKAEQSLEEEELSDEEEETWGRGKHAYYADNADDMESDDEEANEMEEQEAKRLQSKGREDMEDADFGLDDKPEVGRTEADDILVEEVPVATIGLPQDRKALIRHLEKTNPETLALARDWEDTAYGIERTRERIKIIEAREPGHMALGMIHLYYQTLLTYATTLAFYFRLRVSPQYGKAPESLRSHSIMSRLLTLKQALSTMEDLDFVPDSYSDDGSDVDSSDEDFEASIWDSLMITPEDKLDASELADLLADSGLEIDADDVLDAPGPPKKKRKTLTEDASKSKKDKQEKKAKKPAQPVFDLVEPEFTSSKPSKNTFPDNLADAYGEATSLQHADAADKSARRKSLRFHTSKIESASAKRKGARDRAMGGDDDIPYRERRKDKEARLAKEAAARGLGQGGEDLDDIEPPPKASPKADLSAFNEEEDMDDVIGYYELVKKTSKERKEKKKADYEAANARPDIEEEQTDGPRSLTRAILANKGLTPHRPKSVRNPRVKKRLKFEKAKKKLSSQKAVYKGGLAQHGRYDGEKSGISKVVKSVRLG